MKSKKVKLLLMMMKVLQPGAMNPEGSYLAYVQNKIIAFLDKAVLRCRF
jgi:hypothetical protein